MDQEPRQDSNGPTEGSGTQVRDVVVLHPETVSKGEELAKEAKRNKRKPYKPRIKTDHIKVDPRVWEKAMELAEGEHRRLYVQSSTEIIVMNNPKGK